MITGRAIDIRARAVAWVKADPPGAEFAEIQLDAASRRSETAQSHSCETVTSRPCETGQS